MINFNIDNTDAGTIERTILWQYEGAPNLVNTILMFKDFFKSCTTDFFDGIVSKIDLTNEDIDDYGLSVWGKILNVPRPILEYGGSSNVLSASLYRRILIARFQLLSSNASLEAYGRYLQTAFEGRVSMEDGLDMGVVFSAGSNITEEENALISQYPDVAFLFPAGVRSGEHSTSNMFCLAENNAGDVVNGVTLTSATGQPTETEFSVGGLDESGFNWRLTPEGNWR